MVCEDGIDDWEHGLGESEEFAAGALQEREAVFSWGCDMEIFGALV